MHTILFHFNCMEFLNGLFMNFFPSVWQPYETVFISLQISTVFNPSAPPKEELALWIIILAAVGGLLLLLLALLILAKVSLHPPLTTSWFTPD